jgi:hypothetical protein
VVQGFAEKLIFIEVVKNVYWADALIDDPHRVFIVPMCELDGDKYVFKGFKKSNMFDFIWNQKSGDAFIVGEAFV